MTKFILENLPLLDEAFLKALNVTITDVSISLAKVTILQFD